MAKVLILYVEAGYGHRKVAEAIGSELRSRQIPDMQVEVGDALEKTNGLFRTSYPQIYYQMVVWVPWLWKFFYYATNVPWIYSLIQPLRSLWNRFQAGHLLRYLIQEKFDFILFTHFFPAEVCGTAKKAGLIQSRLITVVTDVIPHAVWQNPGTDDYWVMAEESMMPLIKAGVPKNQIHPKGIPISSDFLRAYDLTNLRAKFGLDSERLAILFTSGSFGTGPTERILDSLTGLKDRIQVLVVCGKNEALFKALNRRRFPFPVVLFGFVENMYEIMSVSHLLIAKPGGATMVESLAKGLPMIIVAPIPGQESYNAEWLLQRGAGFQIKKPTEIKEIISRVIEDTGLLDSVHGAVARTAKPNATQDIADFILNQSEAVWKTQG